MAHLSKALVRDADDALAALDAALATILADCPHCFESSGYVWEHGNDWNSGPWSHQTNIPCRACNGTVALFEREQARRDLYSDCLQAALWLLVFAMMLIRWGMM